MKEQHFFASSTAASLRPRPKGIILEPLALEDSKTAASLDDAPTTLALEASSKTAASFDDAPTTLALEDLNLDNAPMTPTRRPPPWRTCRPPPEAPPPHQPPHLATISKAPSVIV